MHNRAHVLNKLFEFSISLGLSVDNVDMKGIKPFLTKGTQT